MATRANAASQLAAPGSLRATALSLSAINLTWTDTNTRETGYAIQRSTTPNGGFDRIATTTPNATSYQDTGLTGSKTYYYRARALGPSGTYSNYSAVVSAKTAGDTTPPSVPAGLVAVGVSCSQVFVGWLDSTDSGSGVKSYNLYRDGVLLSRLTAPLRVLLDSGLAAARTYSYSVSAIDNAGNQSARSQVVSTTTPLCVSPTPVPTPTPAPTPTPTRTPTPSPTGDHQAPSVPSSVRAAPVNCAQMNVSWSPSSDSGGSGLAGYLVYRNGTPVQVVLAPGTATSDKEVAESTAYAYGARSFDYAGNASAQSATSSANTPPCPNQPPNAQAGPDQSGMARVTFVFNGSASSDPDGAIVSYSWNFGDGSSASGPVAVHAFAQVGTYTVTLTVTDDQAAIDSDTAVVTVAPDPGPWAKRMGGAGFDVGEAVATDASGNVLIAGRFTGSASFGTTTLVSAGGYDAFVAKLSPAGNTIWVKRFGGAADDMAFGVAADASGDVVVTGFFSDTTNFGGSSLTSAGNYDIFVAKLSGSNGGHLWSKRFGGTGTDAGYSLALDSSGNPVVAGLFFKTIDFGGGALNSTIGGVDSFVVKLSGANGAHLWSHNFWSSGVDIANAVAVDWAGNVVVAGHFLGRINFGQGEITSYGQSDAYVLGLTPSGGLRWSKRFGSTSSDAALGVAVDLSGNAVVTGYFAGTADFGGGPLVGAGLEDVFVVKLAASSGAHLWSRRFGGGSNDDGYTVAVESDGDVLVSGSCFATVDFGTGPLPSAGLADAFATRLRASDGATLWARRYGGINDDIAFAATVDPSGVGVLTGYFQNQVNFGGQTLTSSGIADVFVHRLAP